jgi:polyisoprenoid-binding protein YceI
MWGLAGCDSIPRKEEPAPVPAGTFAIPAHAAEYRVVPAESLLQVYVFRGGAMAKLGHNHVVASHDLSGAVYVTDDPLRTRFDLTMPVGKFTVDEPSLRERAGADFPPHVPQNARDGTHRNLMSEALLDAANYPDIRLRAMDVAAVPGGAFDVTVEVLIKGQAHTVHAPVTLRREGEELRASGEFPLSHSQLGLKPFTAAMGALAVLDDMTVKFELVARK